MDGVEITECVTLFPAYNRCSIQMYHLLFKLVLSTLSGWVDDCI